MRILVVCQYYYPEPFRITDICETLVQRGHQVTVLTGLPNYPEGRIPEDYCNGNRRNEVINGVKVIRNFEIGRGDSRFELFLNYISYALSASLKALRIRDEFDVVMVNQLSPVLMGLPAMVYKRRYRKKVLLYCLDLWPASLAAGGIEENSAVYKLFLKISKWIYNSADMIMVTSSMFRAYFEGTLEMDTEKMVHLPQYAEELYSTCNGHESENAVRGDAGTYNFVFAGNVGDMQSVDTIVRAAHELKEHSDIMFHIVGDGSKTGECKQLANDLRLANVIFHGRRPVDEMPYFYGMASAMLITLKDNRILSYTLPGKVQSYMAAGKPIIGAINGEAARVIAEAGCGLCCAAEDYKGLSELILHFCRSDNAEQMAANAQGYYSSNFSKERFITKLENSLVSLAD